nr:spermine synthase-like [Ciona intestinalis]|eukprot:XP_002126555.1 spermine synthase-like [Ciona intestinalis]
MDSWLLEFRFKKEILKDSKLSETFIDGLVEAVHFMIDGGKVVFKNNHDCVNQGFTVFIQEPNISSVLIQGMRDGVLTFDLHLLSMVEPEVFDKKVLTFHDKLLEHEGIVRRKTSEFEPLGRIKRGRTFSPYERAATGLVIEHDFDKLVFDGKSPYQTVRILHSMQFGNCLVLDNDMNLAESDISYTVAITGGGREDYRGKNVLILGGGDGGILHHLRDKGARMITMIDIDRMVVDAAKIHLRGICGDAMDREEGDNYKIIVEDCVPHLKKFAAEGQKFDYVINDLTAIPISLEPTGSFWDFLRLILSLSIDVLEEDGKYFTQGNSSNMRDALQMYEDQLNKLEVKVSFSKETVCVPSYHELWVFYTLWKSAQS